MPKADATTSENNPPLSKALNSTQRAPMAALLAALLLIASLFVSSSLAAANVTVVNLVPNGSFESFPDPSSLPPLYVDNCSRVFSFSAYDCLPPLAAAVPPWSWDNRLDVIYGPDQPYGIACSDGLACIDLNALAEWPSAMLSAPLTLTAGHSYLFTIDIGGMVASCGCGYPVVYPQRNISVSFYPQGSAAAFAVFPLSLDMSNGTCRWDAFSFNFTAPVSLVNMTIESTLPPVFNPKIVPRSYSRLNST